MNSTKLFTAAIISLALTFQVQSVPSRSFIIGALIGLATYVYLDNLPEEIKAQQRAEIAQKVADMREIDTISEIGGFLGHNPKNSPWNLKTIDDYRCWAKIHLPKPNPWHCQGTSLEDVGYKKTN